MITEEQKAEEKELLMAAFNDLMETPRLDLGITVTEMIKNYTRNNI
jgi:hypothetical protein